MVAVFETVMTFGTVLILGAGIAAYASMAKLNSADRLTMVRGELAHAAQWARHYNREAIDYRKKSDHIASARALVKRAQRMRTARKLATKAHALELKLARTHKQKALVSV